jgi:predicted PurR-regulated permease PerM
MDSEQQAELDKQEKERTRLRIVLFIITIILLFIVYKIFGKKTALTVSVFAFMVSFIITFGSIFFVSPEFVLALILGNLYITYKLP